MNKSFRKILISISAGALLFFSINIFLRFKLTRVAALNYKSEVRSMNELLFRSYEVLRDIRDTNKELDRKNSELEEERAVLKDKLYRLEINSDTTVPLSERVRKISASLDKVDLSSRDKRRMAALLKSVSREIRSLNKVILRLAKDEPLYKERFKKKDREYKDSVARVKELEEELSGVNKRLESYGIVLAKLESSNKEYGKALDEKEKRIKRYETDISDLRDDREALEKRLGEKQSALETLRAEIKSMEAEYSGMLDDNARSMDNYRRQLDELEKVRGDLNERLARSEFLLGDIDGKNLQVEKENKEYLAANEQLKREIKESLGKQAVYAGDVDNLNAVIEARDREIAGLKERVGLFEREKERYSLEKVNLGVEIASYNEKISDLEKEARDLRDALEKEQGQRQDVESFLEDREKENLLLSSLKRDFEEENGRIKDAIADKKKMIASLEEEIGTLKEELKRTRDLYDSASGKIEDMTAELAKRAEIIVTLQGDAAVKDSEVLELKSSLAENIKNLAVLRENIVKVKMVNNRLSGMLKEKEDLVSSLRQEIINIGVLNQQFKGYIERTSRLFKGEAKPDVKTGERDNSSPGKVAVELEAVEAKQ